jgi:membrane protein
MRRTQDSVPQPEESHRHRKISGVTIAQSCFLTTKFYLKNRLASYASACAFGFLFSSIPVFMMTLVVLIRLFRASPAGVSRLLRFISQFDDYFNLEAVIDSIESIHTIGLFEVVLGVFIFWMARRFFATLIDSMQCIFHTAQTRRPLINQILTIASEVLIVIITAVTVLLFLSLRTIFELPLFAPVFSRFAGSRGQTIRFLFSQLPDILMLMIMTMMYRTGPGTKPPLRLCFFSAAGCTLLFHAVRLLMNSFIDLSRYNLIYGVLGKLIVVLMEVFFFFMIFLFFAQFIFVFQFFDELLLGELYLLPRRDTPGAGTFLRRTLFIRPDFLLAQDVKVITLAAGDRIFNPSDTGTDAYYVARGTIEETKKQSCTRYERGDFFGELSCILNTPREGTARALTDAQVVRIDAETFRTLLTQNSDAATKALGQISSYFAKVYGRSERYLL